MIFEGDKGNVYGSPVKLTTDAEVPSGKELTIRDGQELVVGDDVTLTNNGTLTVEPGGRLEGEVGGDGTVDRPPNETGVTSVSVDGTAGTISGTTITVVLPYGKALPTNPNQITITPAGEKAAVSNLGTADNGATWTFTVTAEDMITTQDYTINISIAPDPAAGNKADVAKAKTAIETHTWTVGQATANTREAVKAWLEDQLSTMDLNGVACEVSVTGFTPAAAGTKADNAGKNGSFTFTAALSKGADDTLAEGAVTGVNGTITATPYQAKNHTVSVTASPAEGGKVSGGGTYTENTPVTVTAKANSGHRFIKWTENGQEVSTSASYTFTLTGGRALVAVFAKDDPDEPEEPEEPEKPEKPSKPDNGGSDTSSPTHGKETLTNSGVTLTGDRVHEYARLTVIKDRLHSTCTGCDQLRRWQQQGRVIAVYDVSLSYGFRGSVTLTFPVPAAYEGKTLTVAHCRKDTLETHSVTVSGGKVTVTVDSLSPFAILDTAKAEVNPDTGAPSGVAASEAPQTPDISGAIVLCVLAVMLAAAALYKRRSKTETAE